MRHESDSWQVNKEKKKINFFFNFCWVNILYNKCYLYNNFIISLVVKLLEIVLGQKKKICICVYIYIYNLGLKEIIITLGDYLQLCSGGGCGGGGNGGGYGGVVMVAVVVIIVYCSWYIILLCYLYYFIVLKVKIKLLMLDIL